VSRHALIGVVVLAVISVAAPAADQRGRAGVTAPAKQAAQPQRPAPGALKVGDLAPDFTLEPRGGGPAVTLSSFRNRQPVALVFGSYT